jgi:hypothetical protein
MPCWITWITCALLALPARDEFGEQLARLAAPRAAERAAAERWLQAHLVLERYPALAEAALAGDAEVRARLARVLSADTRHLGLALALCAEKDPGLTALGREAVRAGVARAEPRLGEIALRDGLEALLARAASESAPESLRLAANRPLGELLEELMLAVELPLGLTFDTRVATSTPRRDDGSSSGPSSGPWNEVLLRLAGGRGLTLECHGWPRGRTLEIPTGAFLRFAPSGEPARTGVEHVSEWLIALARPGEEGARVLAARNLAATGFAPGLAWMEELVRTRGDRAAREGLLLGAARGLVAPVLLAPEVLGPLLVEAEQQGGARSGRILAALARAGCFDARAQALAPRLLAELDGASARGRWIRLFLLERNGCEAPPGQAAGVGALEPRLAAMLADASTPAALRLQALYTLARLGPSGAPAVAGLEEVFRLPLDARERERLGRVLAALSVAPPWADAARIPAGWGGAERGALLEAWLWQSRTDTAAAHLAARLAGEPATLAARGEALAEELAPWLARGAGAELAQVLTRARALSPSLSPSLASELERLQLLLGLVPAGEVPGVLERRRFALVAPDADLAVLAVLGGYPRPLEVEKTARDRLLARLGAALAENRPLPEVQALLAALERAAQGLYAGGRDRVAAEDIVGPVRQLLQRTKGGRRMDLRAWPAPPFALQRDVALEVGRAEVPASL